MTGVGFQPKIVLFWWAGGHATTEEVAGGNIAFGFGAAISSTSRFAITHASDDALAASDVGNLTDVGYCIGIINAARLVQGAADFKSMDADGFTLTIDDQFPSDYRISYLALGGTDLTNVYIGNKQRDNDTGNCAVTGVGFQPDAVICAANIFTNASGGGSHYLFSLGWATGSSNQGVVAVQSYDNQTTSNTHAYGYNGEIAASIFSTDVLRRDSFVSFDADGFTLNQLEGTSQYYYHFICLKGGQYEVGDLTTRTDGNDIEETLAGAFRPVAVMFGSVNAAIDTQDNEHAHSRLSIGAGTSTSNRAVQAISDEDNLADTETAYANYDSAVYAHVVDDAIVGLMDIKSIDATGFTAVMDDTDPSACWVTYLAIGAAAAAGDIMQIATVDWANAGQFAGVANASIAQVIGVVAN